MTERDNKILKTALGLSHLQHLDASKEGSTRHNYGQIPQIFSWNSACWSASEVPDTMHSGWEINMMSKRSVCGCRVPRTQNGGVQDPGAVRRTHNPQHEERKLSPPQSTEGVLWDEASEES